MITFATKQLNRKHKHASDFGVTANNNGPGREAFRLAMIAHVNASTTQTVTAGSPGRLVRDGDVNEATPA